MTRIYISNWTLDSLIAHFQKYCCCNSSEIWTVKIYETKLARRERDTLLYTRQKEMTCKCRVGEWVWGSVSVCVCVREGGRKMTKRRKKKDKTKGMRIGVMYIYVNFPLTVYIDHDDWFHFLLACPRTHDAWEETRSGAVWCIWQLIILDIYALPWQAFHASLGQVG